ncbi:MAG: hypothetical protein MUF83_22570 [Acidimicrobiales bacterium]|jgi:hypothetical protein|nr:hypothetical protein [Acidimicrobiales bacterium]
MDTYPSRAKTTAALAPGLDPNALWLTPLPASGLPSFRLSHPYVELVYTASLGPTAVMLARRLDRLVVAFPGGVSVCAVMLARELGLRATSEEPLGGRSQLRKSLDRLAHVNFIEWLDEQHVGVRSAVPAVSDRVRDTLPETVRQAHDHFVKVIDLRDGRP